MSYTDSREKCRGILARLLRLSGAAAAGKIPAAKPGGLKSNKAAEENMNQPLSVQDREDADRLMLKLTQHRFRHIEGHTGLKTFDTNRGR